MERIRQEKAAQIKAASEIDAQIAETLHAIKGFYQEIVGNLNEEISIWQCLKKYGDEKERILRGETELEETEVKVEGGEESEEEAGTPVRRN